MIDDIRRFIQVDILNDPAQMIETDQDLMLTETLNSLSVTLLIAHLENQCDFEIPPEDITLENFGTLRRIDCYISERRRTSS